MIHQFYRINRPLTLSDNRKCWVTTALALAGSVASSIFGGAKAASAAKKAKKEQTYRANAEKAWYDKNYNTDYIDTKAGQNLMRRAQEVQNEYVRKADGAAAVGGGTAASVVQAKEGANKTMGDAIANVAAQDTARKAQVSDQHLANVQGLSRERENTENQRATNVTNAASNASNALMTAAGSIDSSANKQSNNNLAVTQSSQGNTNSNTPPQVNPTAVLYEGAYGKGAAPNPIPSGTYDVGQAYDPLELATGAKKKRG